MVDVGQKRMRGRPVKYDSLTTPHTVTLLAGNWQAWQKEAQQAGMSVSEAMVYLSMLPQFSEWLAQASESKDSM
jgi:hypothetical protein